MKGERVILERRGESAADHLNWGFAQRPLPNVSLEITTISHLWKRFQLWPHPRVGNMVLCHFLKYRAFKIFSNCWHLQTI